MNRRKLSIFLFFLVISMVSNAQDAPEEPAVVQFNNLITTKLSLGYNVMFFEETAREYSLQTNRPWDVGLGLGIKNLFLEFAFSIPFLYDRNYQKSQSFDITINHYYKHRSLTYGYMKVYNGFHNRDENDIELTILNMGISQVFILNQDHSLRSVYNLDEIQMKSNGSFLLGGGLFFTAIQSDSENLSNFNDIQRTFHFGPNFGYSYIWVFDNNLFVNVLSTFGLDALVTEGQFSAGFQMLPRFSFGYHGKTWSANIIYNYSILIGGFQTELEYYLISGSIGIVFIKQFL